MPEPSERFTRYAGTIVDVVLPDGSRVSVRPGHPPPAELEDLLPLLVITAWNPGGERPGAVTNEAANGELLTRLRALARDPHSVTILPAVGRAADNSHSEESFAIHGIDRDDAIALGVHMRQDAIFEITPEGMVLVDCGG